jgi:hypothetical protein
VNKAETALQDFRKTLQEPRGESAPDPADPLREDTMHILDYSLIGFLIAIMVWAGAMALHGAR